MKVGVKKSKRQSKTVQVTSPAFVALIETISAVAQLTGGDCLPVALIDLANHFGMDAFQVVAKLRKAKRVRR